MQALISGISNTKTTLAGSTAGLAIIAAALEQTDVVNKIIYAIVGLAVIALGIFSKDSTTGSQPSKLAFYN